MRRSPRCLGESRFGEGRVEVEVREDLREARAAASVAAVECAGCGADRFEVRAADESRLTFEWGRLEAGGEFASLSGCLKPRDHLLAECAVVNGRSHGGIDAGHGKPANSH